MANKGLSRGCAVATLLFIIAFAFGAGCVAGDLIAGPHRIGVSAAKVTLIRYGTKDLVRVEVGPGQRHSVLSYYYIRGVAQDTIEITLESITFLVPRRFMHIRQDTFVDSGVSNMKDLSLIKHVRIWDGKRYADVPFERLTLSP